MKGYEGDGSVRTWLMTAYFGNGYAIDFQCEAPDLRTARRVGRALHPGALSLAPSLASGPTSEGEESDA